MPACSSVPDDPFRKIPADVRRYFAPGNRIEPLFGADSVYPSDQDIWVRTYDAVRQARSSLQIEMYNVDRPAMVDLLILEASQGVHVQVIMDPPRDDHDAPRQAAIDKLRRGGVEVKLYPLPPQPATGSLPPLDHVKMLLVDGRQAIIGGMNWGSHSPANHDFDVVIEGPAVARMEWLFREDWLHCGGAPDTLPPIATPPPSGDDYVNLVVTADDPHERTIAKTVLRAIRNARTIHAEMFALTEYRVVDALIEAKTRGAEVKIIVDPLKIGASRINERAVARLRAAGVEVRWYVCNPDTLEKMHAKTGIFDDDQVIVGSANWTAHGFESNREADVEILSRTVNEAFERQFQADWAHRTADTPTYLPAAA